MKICTVHVYAFLAPKLGWCLPKLEKMCCGIPEKAGNLVFLIQSLGSHPLTLPDRIRGLFWLLHLVKGYVHGDEQIRLGCLNRWLPMNHAVFPELLEIAFEAILPRRQQHNQRYTKHHSILKFLAETTTMDTSERLRVDFGCIQKCLLYSTDPRCGKCFRVVAKLVRGSLGFPALR